jgi:di/tripeptidase
VRPTDTTLLWLVTGGDEAAVERAAAAFDVESLRDAFAVTVGPSGVEALPLEASR